MPEINLDGFSAISLTARVNHQAYIPTKLRAMDLFDVEGVDTITVAIEEDHEGAITLVQPSARGSENKYSADGERKLRDLRIPHLKRGVSLQATEVQGVRSFEDPSKRETILSRWDKKVNLERQSIYYTHEHMMMGAVMGVIKDAKGGTIYDLFTEFGAAQEAVFEFDFDGATSDEAGTGALSILPAARQLKTKIKRNLGGMPTGALTVHAFCGENFFDQVTANQETRKAYREQSSREGGDGEMFKYGGVTFELYDGNDDVKIDTDDCQAFARNVPGLFKGYFGPADTFDFVNTEGVPLYVILEKMNQKGMYGEVQSNPLFLCTRPKSLITCRKKA